MSLGGFIGFAGSAFSSTQFVSNLGSDAIKLGASAGLNYLIRGGQLKFTPPKGYENVLVYVAKRTLMQNMFARINNLYPAYVRQLENANTKLAYEINQGIWKQIVIDSNAVTENSLMNGKNDAKVQYMGKPAPEGLVIWVEDPSGIVKDIDIQTYWDKIRGLSSEQASEAKNMTKTILRVAAYEDKVFFDLGALVNAQSANNVVLTQVQGRSYSRKELISGGDVNFNVSGVIASNYPDVYPHKEVSQFVTLMQHPGVLRVSNLMFKQFNVSQIVIKDFKLSPVKGCKNVQPYSFSCVGVEPDEEVAVIKDTVYKYNTSVAQMKKKGWAAKLLEQVAKSAADQALQLTEKLTADSI